MNLSDNNQRRWLLLSVLTIFLFGAAPAQAHYPWVETDNFSPAPPNAPQIRIGWGHDLPATDFLAMEDLQELFILSPDGTKFPLTPESTTNFSLQEKLADGTYLVAGRRKAGFYTKTTEGGKKQSKKGLDNVVKCSWSTMSMKGVINGGTGQSTVDQVAGHPLEIIPLANPAQLKVGDTLPLRILFNGQPFSGKIEAIHYDPATKKAAEAVQIPSDQKDLGEMGISAPGFWLVKAQHELPFQQPEECDVESYVATLTFSIK